MQFVCGEDGLDPCQVRVRSGFGLGLALTLSPVPPPRTLSQRLSLTLSLSLSLTPTLYDRCQVQFLKEPSFFAMNSAAFLRKW